MGRDLIDHPRVRIDPADAPRVPSEMHPVDDARPRAEIEDSQVTAPKVGQDALAKEPVVSALLEGGVAPCIQPANKTAHDSLPRIDQHEQPGIGQQPPNPPPWPYLAR
jgi:hypothetical protein